MKRYAKFYDLTYLFDYNNQSYRDFEALPRDYSEEYHNKVNEYLKNKAFKDGDIVFIGHTYETRQEYGFYPIKDHKMLSPIFDTGDFLEIPGVYYKKAVEAMNNFWNEFSGDPDLVYDDNIKELKEKGMWSMEKDIAANTIQNKFRKSRGYAEWKYNPERLNSEGYFNDLSFGKTKRLSLKTINKLIKLIN